MPQLATKEDLEILGKQLLLDRKKVSKTLIVCGGTGCKASRSQDVIDALNRELLMQEMLWAFFLARLKAGSNSAARIAMMAITTNSSISVKARPIHPRCIPPL